MEPSALVSGEYESDEPGIRPPIALARELGFRLKGLTSECHKVVGTEVSVFKLGLVNVRVITEDKVSDWVETIAACVTANIKF